MMSNGGNAIQSEAMWNDVENVLKWLPDPGTGVGAVFYAVICIAAAWLAGWLVRSGVHRTLDYHVPAADPTVVKFLGRLARLLIYILAFLVYAHIIPALRSMTPVWLTSVGAVSVVVGLAAQSTLSNLVAGVALLLYRPFHIGDRLHVSAPTGHESGVVEELGLGYTTLLTDDGRRIIVPNSVMAGATCISEPLPPARERRAGSVAAVTLSYSADLDKARAAMTDLARSHAKVIEVAGCKVTALTETGVTMTLKAWCVDAATAEDVRCDLLEGILKRFAAEGITVAHR
ncbi:MAG TPA: mechanosensitive ion channel family protein [Phycisphaerae bacterium]|nr:mechanosensitive ion channel family protein [Phycisphaerae bacterium]